jgi:hypothetical protein
MDSQPPARDNVLDWGIQTMMIKKTLALLLIASLSLLAGCVSDQPPKPKPKVAQPNDPFSGANSPIIFQGTVLGRLPSPGAVSGIFTFFQGVRYRVNKVESGNMHGGEVIVYHILSTPPLTQKDQPELSEEIFKPGNKLRVRCERTRNGDYVDVYGTNTVEVMH